MGLHRPGNWRFVDAGLPIDDDSFFFALQFDDGIDTASQHFLVAVAPHLSFNESGKQGIFPLIEALDVALAVEAYNWEIPLDLLLESLMNTRAERSLIIQDFFRNALEAGEWADNF